MALQKKPYLVIPKLIEQPTWGGTYILTLKNWSSRSAIQEKKIGQSYELFGKSKLALAVNDSSDPRFVPEIGFADKSDILTDLFPLKDGVDYVTLQDELEEQMPLLIKINQAAGNSFQLHVPPEKEDEKWKAKPESWYFLEKGYVTLGVKPGVDIETYKQVCIEINGFMTDLSARVRQNLITREEAEKTARKYILEMNPWNYVNRYEVEPNTLIDLSMGAIHHSWEENTRAAPLGNVVYEVQRDVMDPVSTIRAFDQGKLKSDGSIRPLNIEDYFKYLDTTPEHNAYSYLHKKQQGDRLLSTRYYSLDTLTLDSPEDMSVDKSFNHLFLRQGKVKVASQEGSVVLTRGHSCFVPKSTGTVILSPLEKNSVLLKTYIS